jgi:hypothetical protein
VLVEMVEQVETVVQEEPGVVLAKTIQALDVVALEGILGHAVLLGQ